MSSGVSLLTIAA
jgi:hypothetical protein